MGPANILIVISGLATMCQGGSLRLITPIVSQVDGAAEVVTNQEPPLAENTELTSDNGRKSSQTVLEEAHPNQVPLSHQGENLENILQSEPKARGNNTLNVTEFDPLEILPQYEHATVIRKYHPKVVKRSRQNDEITQPPATIVSPSKGKLEEHYKQFHKNSPQDTITEDKIEDNTDASYRFGFAIDQQTRNEKSDSKGNVEGSYSYIGDDGFLRKVEYEAGAKVGFRIIKVILQKVANSTKAQDGKKEISDMPIGDTSKDKTPKEETQSKNDGDNHSIDESPQEDEPVDEDKDGNFYSLYYKKPQQLEYKSNDRTSSLHTFDTVGSSNLRLSLNGQKHPTTQVYDGQLSKTNNPSVSVNDGSYLFKQTFTNPLVKKASSTYTGVPLFTPINRSVDSNKDTYEAKEIKYPFFKSDASFENNPRNPDSEKGYSYLNPTSKLTDQLGQTDTLEESIEQDSPRPSTNYRIVNKKGIENNPNQGHQYFLSSTVTKDVEPKADATSGEPKKHNTSYKANNYMDETTEENNNVPITPTLGTDYSTQEAILEPKCIRRLVATQNRRRKKVHRKRKRKNSKNPPQKPQENFIKINPDRSYSFAYKVKDHSRQELVDSEGNVHSSYQTKGNDGTKTVVVFNRRAAIVPRTSFLLVQNPTDDKYLSYLKPSIPRNQLPSGIAESDYKYDTTLGHSGNSPYHSREEPLHEDSSDTDYADESNTNPADTKNRQNSQDVQFTADDGNYQNSKPASTQEQTKRLFRGAIKFKMPETLVGEDHYY